MSGRESSTAPALVGPEEGQPLRQRPACQPVVPQQDEGHPRGQGGRWGRLWGAKVWMGRWTSGFGQKRDKCDFQPGEWSFRFTLHIVVAEIGRSGRWVAFAKCSLQDGSMTFHRFQCLILHT